jgi:hypothetical protein
VPVEVELPLLLNILKFNRSITALDMELEVEVEAVFEMELASESERVLLLLLSSSIRSDAMLLHERADDGGDTPKSIN